MFVCTGCLLNTEKLQDVNTWMNFHRNPACVHILKTDITHQYFRASPVGDAKFCSSSCSDPHLCQEGGESHKLPFFLVLLAKGPVISLQTVPFTAEPLPHKSYKPQSQLHGSLSLSLSLFQPQSGPPKLQCCTSSRLPTRLRPGLVRPETIGGHEAVCKAPAKPSAG